MEFKKDDLIECIDNTCSPSITIGAIYRIYTISTIGQNKYLQIINNSGSLQEYYPYRFKLKEQSMDKRQLLNKHNEELKAMQLKQRQEIEALEPETWDCVTPVDYSGDISFNNGEQRLSVDIEYEAYDVVSGEHTDHSSSFCWIKTTREELKPDDTAYRYDSGIPSFSSECNVCKILSDETFAFVYGLGISVARGEWSHWYKLVRKDEV